MLNTIKEYITGIILDPDSWLGIALALVVLFILPAALLKISLLGVCIYLIVKPNKRREFIKALKK